MYKIAVMGDYESIYGFASLGLETFPVTLPRDAKKILENLAEQKYAVIYMTEALAEVLSKEIEELKEKQIPAVILIPGTYGNTGRGVKTIRESVEKAVGSDILFGE